MLKFAHSVGCMAIWHVTVPNRLLSLVVIAGTPLLKVRPGPGNEPQEVVEKEVVGKFGLGD